MAHQFKVGDRVRLTDDAKKNLGFMADRFGESQTITRLTERPYEDPLAHLSGLGGETIDVGWLEPAPPALIDPAKVYQTRDGRAVRIYATDGGGDYPVHGAIKFDGVDEWYTERWTSGGAYVKDDSGSADLIEVKPERSGWFNVYPLGDPAMFYATKAEADDAASTDRIACIPVTFREGDGL